MTGARDDVLAFYRELPFNSSSSPKEAAKLIKKQNSVAAIYPREDDLYYAESIIELGCGTGWLSNTLAYLYPAKVVGVDFNSVAVEFAQTTADELFAGRGWAKFVCADLFSFETEPADIVISNGVLHHTSDCMGGVKKCIELTKQGGKVFIGLYHKYGRKPFLDYFAKLKNEGLNEDELWQKYRLLDSRHSDGKQSKSWFFDQVLHPYETQHTLREVMEVFAADGVKLVATSINGYGEWQDINELYEAEKRMYDIGADMLESSKYYPGFFYVLGEKCEECF